ncbi:hypothetical protein ACH0BM_06635 [Kocuria rhizophila]|uniref:hypothetical protein n=1 Tax=Kocuria rhizophila TaxID=72000 RepID=UPI003879A98B
MTGPDRTPVPTGDSSYGHGARTWSAVALVAAALAVAAAFLLELPDGIRSAAFGAGLVTASSATTVLVAAQMFRVAPAATAPALAGLYLLKVLVAGGLLLTLAPPAWLVPGVFLGAALVGLVLALVGFARLTGRVSGQQTRALVASRSARGADSAAAHDDAAAAPSPRDAPGPRSGAATTLLGRDAPGRHLDALHGSGQPPVGTPERHTP